MVVIKELTVNDNLMIHWNYVHYYFRGEISILLTSLTEYRMSNCLGFYYIDNSLNFEGVIERFSITSSNIKEFRQLIPLKTLNLYTEFNRVGSGILMLRAGLYDLRCLWERESSSIFQEGTLLQDIIFNYKNFKLIKVSLDFSEQLFEDIASFNL